MSELEQPDLAAELIHRAGAGQQARNYFFRGEQPTDAERERVREVDRDNTARLEQIVDQYGWPGHRLVGSEASHAAWLLAQHADRRPELQRNWLPLLRTAVHAGDADPSCLAYLEDRVAMANRRPQRHGTQWRAAHRGGQLRLLPLEDPQRVNEHRAAVGLKPLDDDEIAAAWPDYPAALRAE